MQNNGYTELEVIGFSGQLGERDVPRLVLPLFGVKGSGQVLVPPYEEGDSSVQSVSYMGIREFCDSVEFEVTLLKHPVPADRDRILYADVGLGDVEYVTCAEAAERMTEFSDHHRLLGDGYYRAGDLERAIHEYNLTSCVSQAARDYARLLLCHVPMEREERLRSYIQGQGEDPDGLVCLLRKAFGNPGDG